MIQKILDKVVYVIEIIVAAVLVLLSGLLLFSLISNSLSYIGFGTTFGRTEFLAMISIVLEVFILVELFRIAIAYMNHDNVVPTVLEAALVAVARKIVILEPKGDMLTYSLSLAILLFAVAISWFLLARSQSQQKITKKIAERISNSNGFGEPTMSHTEAQFAEASDSAAHNN